MAAGTVTYRYPPSVAGGATGPTLAQMGGGLNKVVADVAFASADTIATITHSLNESPADGSGSNPDVQVTVLAGGVLCPQLIVAYASANTITVVRADTGATLTGTYRVAIRRVHTLDL
jgi:hypothetical protein